MARLPIPGSDDGSWGDILNAYLLQSLAADGSIRTGVVGSPQLADNAVTSAKLAPSAVTTSHLGTGSVTNSAIADGAIAQGKIANLSGDLAGKADSVHTHTASQISDATTAGRSLMTAADATAQRTALGLGSAATLTVGTTAGTVAAGDDSRLTGAVQTSGLDAATAALVGNGGSETRASLSSTFATKAEVAGIGGGLYAIGNATGATTVAASNGQAQTLTLTGNATLTLAGSADGGTLTLVITQGSGGSKTITWPSNVAWAAGAPILSTAAGAIDVVTLLDVGSYWLGFISALGFTAPDVTAPTTPAGLTATAASSTSVSLSWSASSDAVGVTGYEYRVDGGAAVDAGAGTTETVTGLTASTSYTFEVRAYDAAGNRSGWSASASATTDPAVTILGSDTFNRANGNLGTSDGPGSHAWSSPDNNMTIVSNEASAGASATRAIMTVGQADQKVTATVRSSVASGVILRSDTGATAFYRVIFSGGTWYIVHVTGTTTTTTRDSWTQANPSLGDTIGAKAVTNGANVDFTVYHNGVAVRTYSETNPSYVLSGTRAGIWGNSGAKLDNFECVAP